MIWPATILLFTQIATVWQALRISVVRRGLRIAATVLFVLSMIAAVANLFAAKNSAFVAFAFLAATVLYFVAPFSIVQHVGYRRTVDQETMLGALATYLFIGIAFAFAYRLVGAAQGSPSTPTGTRWSMASCSSCSRSWSGSAARCSCSASGWRSSKSNSDCATTT